MKEIIINYQNAFNKIISKLSKNSNVLGIFTFGSIVSGDIWEGSDIDLFVVYKNEFNKIRDLHSEVLDIPVHMKILSKESFLKSHEEEGKNGIAQKILIKSKLIFSNDKEIRDLYNSFKYVLRNNVEEENLMYLGELLKEIGVCKKYLENDGLYTSFEMLMKALDKFAKLYLSLNGYSETKDSINMVMNLEKSFEKCMLNILDEKVTEKEINNVIDYLEKYINENILKASSGVLKIFRNSKVFLNTSEIKEMVKENCNDIKMQFILKELYKIGAINKKLKVVKDSTGHIITSELVYGFK